MLRKILRLAPLALLMLSGCDVLLTVFAVPLQATAGSNLTITIGGDISGTTGFAGCVMQLPIGWTVLGMTSTPTWPITINDANLLANYTAEPGHYLVAASGTGTGGIGGGQTLSHINLTVTVLVPANADGAYHAKLSLAGQATASSAWVIQEPAGVAQFAAITAAPYSRPIYVGVPVPTSFVNTSSGLPTAASIGSVAFGDVDGDGADDLAVVSSGSLRCFLSRPGPTWIERSAGLNPTGASAGLAFGDLDGDGFLDLFDGNGHVYFGDGGNAWTLGPALPLPSPATDYVSVAIGDVDGDGRLDLAIGHRTNGTIRVLHNNGNRTFTNASNGLPASPSSGDVVNNLLLVDLDGDGDLDLQWAHLLTPNLWRNDGSGNWTAGVGIPAQVRASAPVDVDGDGIPELLVASDGNPGIVAYKYAFGSSWAPLPVAGLPTSNGPSSLAAIDFDRDGRTDLIVGNRSSQGGIDLERNTGSGFASAELSGLPALVQGTTTAIAVGDFDGNTFPDLATAVNPQFVGSSEFAAWQNLSTGVAELGAGCAGGTFAEPQLAALGAPTRGNASFAMRVSEPAPGTLAIFWFGGSRTLAAPFDLPLDVTPFGAPNCTVWASLDFTFFGLLDAGGTFTTALPVPNVPALQHATAFAQGGVFASGANAFGMLFTRGVAIRIE